MKMRHQPESTEACLVGQQSMESIPYLQRNLKWSRCGITVLGVKIGRMCWKRWSSDNEHTAASRERDSTQIAVRSQSLLDGNCSAASQESWMTRVEIVWGWCDRTHTHLQLSDSSQSDTEDHTDWSNNYKQTCSTPSSKQWWGIISVQEKHWNI